MCVCLAEVKTNIESCIFTESFSKGFPERRSWVWGDLIREVGERSVTGNERGSWPARGKKQPTLEITSKRFLELFDTVSWNPMRIGSRRSRKKQQRVWKTSWTWRNIDIWLYRYVIYRNTRSDFTQALIKFSFPFSKRNFVDSVAAFRSSTYRHILSLRMVLSLHVSVCTVKHVLLTDAKLSSKPVSTFNIVFWHVKFPSRESSEQRQVPLLVWNKWHYPSWWKGESS